MRILAALALHAGVGGEVAALSAATRPFVGFLHILRPSGGGLLLRPALSPSLSDHSPWSQALRLRFAARPTNPLYLPCSSPDHRFRWALRLAARFVDNRLRFPARLLGRLSPTSPGNAFAGGSAVFRRVFNCLLSWRSLSVFGHDDLHCCALLDWVGEPALLSRRQVVQKGAAWSSAASTVR